jgi:hypothetical protein
MQFFFSHHWKLISRQSAVCHKVVEFQPCVWQSAVGLVSVHSRSLLNPMRVLTTLHEYRYPSRRELRALEIDGMSRKSDREKWAGGRVYRMRRFIICVLLFI